MRARVRHARTQETARSLRGEDINLDGKPARGRGALENLKDAFSLIIITMHFKDLIRGRLRGRIANNQINIFDSHSTWFLITIQRYKKGR